MHRRRNGQIWSEHVQGRGRSTDDIMSGVNMGADGLDQVSKQVSEHGVTCKFDCSHCGRQTALVTTWPELAAFFQEARRLKIPVVLLQHFLPVCF